MKILLLLLSSSDLYVLTRTYNLIKKYKTKEFTVKIVINTLDTSYYNKVCNEIKDCEIIETESNGLPGKGHNSQIHIFEQSPEYDYLLKIDGDDFLNPMAFTRLLAYLQCKPDIINLMASETISTQFTAPTALHMNIHNTYYLNYNVTTMVNNMYYTMCKNPLNVDIYNTFTPGILLLISRNMLNYDIFYDEHMTIYDDLITFLKCYKLWKQEKIKMFNILDTNIYLYNKLNENSITSSITHNKCQIANTYFKKHYSNQFNIIKNWDLKEIPVLQYDNKMYLQEKIKFCESIYDIGYLKPINIDYSNFGLFRNYAIQHNLPEMKYIYEEFINESKNTIKLFNNKNIVTFRENDYISNVIKICKCWEPTITNILINILQDADSTQDIIFLDIGCNIGYYSIIASEFCDKIHSFDLNQECLNRFQQSLKINNIENISIHETCLSNTNGDNFILPPIDYKISPSYINVGGLKAIKTKDINNINTNVTSSTLDEFIKNKNITHINLLKIDIEGGEYNALLGSKECLKNKIIKNIIIEITPSFGLQETRNILNILQSAEYKLYNIGLQEHGDIKDSNNLLSILKNKITNIDTFINSIQYQTNILATYTYI